MRRPEWEQHLAALVDQWRHQPFVWGRHDCGQFALAVLRAVSARDWAQISIQSYASARGAQALLRYMNVPDMQALAEKMLGSSLPSAYARRGDLAACSSQHGPALGVCLGGHVAHPGLHGLVFQPFTQALCCWRIE